MSMIIFCLVIKKLSIPEWFEVIYKPTRFVIEF